MAREKCSTGGDVGTIVGITAEDIPAVWPRVVALLEPAVQRADGNFYIEDVYAALVERDWQLWLWVENDAIMACGTTTIVVWPRRKVCEVVLVGGEKHRIEEWLGQSQDVIADWARGHGCDAVQIYGRPGWQRKLSSVWRPVWTMVRRDL